MGTISSRRKGRVNVWRQRVSDVIVFARGGADWRAPAVRTRHRAIFGGGAPTPGPGSEVFVLAEDPNAKKTDYVSLFGAIAHILASTIAIIVVVKR